VARSRRGLSLEHAREVIDGSDPRHRFRECRVRNEGAGQALGETSLAGGETSLAGAFARYLALDAHECDQYPIFRPCGRSAALLPDLNIGKGAERITLPSAMSASQ
jgi:hypothetical protein